MKRGPWKVVKGTGMWEGAYVVEDDGYPTFRTTSEAKARAYVNAQRIRLQLKERLDNIDHQIYNMREDMDSLSKLHRRNMLKINVR